jgi:hypothetical protein
MPQRTLRFCPKCVTTEHAATRDRCGACGTALQPLLDEQGAICRAFLLARNFCCDNGCRNCPYGSEAEPARTSAECTQKICGRCGNVFGCYGKNCWCEAVQLSPAALRWLERTFPDCLCRSCLEQFA